MLKYMECLLLLLVAAVCAAASVPAPVPALPSAPSVPAAESGNVSAAPRELGEWMKKATLNNYPDANAVLLYDRENVCYQPDGSATSSDEYYTKILTENGRRSARQLRFSFNTSYSRFALKKLEIIHPDGKTTPVDIAANSRISTEPGQTGSNIFDPANKILSATVPNLAVGDVLYVRTEETLFKPRIPNQWSGFFVLQSEDPIIRYEIRIDAPASRPLRSLAVKDEVKGALKFKERAEKDRIVYSWTANDVPRLFGEPDMPPMYMCAQRLLVGTAKNWQEISRWYYGLCRPRLNAVSPELKTMVAELVKNAKTPEEKIHRLFQFVSQKIRYVGVTDEHEAPGYEPHDVSQTFAQRHGVCRDKMALLVAMLEQANFKAYPVLFFAGTPKDSEVPNIYFNHAIAAVETAPGVYSLMDPTYETTTELFPSTLSNMSYLVATPSGEILRRSAVTPESDNRLNIRTEAGIDDAGTLSGKTVLSFAGVNDQMYRSAFSRWPAAARKRFLGKMVRNALPGAELVRFRLLPEDVRDMSCPLKLELEYTCRNFIPDSGRDFLLRLPEFGGEVGATAFVLNAVGLKKRKFPLQLFSSCSTEETFQLKLPETVRLRHFPPAREITVPGVLTFRDSRSVKDGVFSGKNFFAMENVEILPPEYLKLKQALRKIERAENEMPVASFDYSDAEKRERFAEADSVILDRSQTVRLDSANAWSSEFRLRRKILTYGGLKKYAELQLPYNPAWETVSVRGGILNPGKSKVELGKKDFVLLDSPESASAPRYPQWKKLVVAFPGATVGSVLEYEITRQYRDRPFFSVIHTFCASSPIRSDRFELDAPESLKLAISPVPFGVEQKSFDRKGRRILVWSAQNRSAIEEESKTAPGWTFLPSIQVSSGNWKDYAEPLYAALEKAASAPSKEIALLASKLAPVSSPVRDRVLAIRNWAAKNLRSAGPSFPRQPLTEISPADRTVLAGYGNSADRAAVIAALLKKADVDYRFIAASDTAHVPVLLGALRKYPRRIFSEILIYIPRLGCYLNDTNQYALLGSVAHEDKIALELPEGNLIAVKPARNFETSGKTSYFIRLSASGAAKVRMRQEYFGVSARAFRQKFSEMTPEELRRFGEQLASKVSQGAELTGSVSLKKETSPAVLEAEFDVPEFAAKSGRYLQFELPDFEIFSQMLAASAGPRKTPALRDSARRETLEYQIEYPAGYEVLPMIPPHREFGNFGSAAFYEYFQVSDRRISIDCGLTLPAEYIAPDAYARIQNMAAELNSPSSRRVILRRKD